MGGSERQRIDKWIWFARVVRSRAEAAKLVQDGNVRVNRARITKPGYDLSPGDMLTIAAHGRVRVLEVLGFAARRGGATEAALLFREAAIPADDAALPKNGDASPSGTC